MRLTDRRGISPVGLRCTSGWTRMGLGHDERIPKPRSRHRSWGKLTSEWLPNPVSCPSLPRHPVWAGDGGVVSAPPKRSLRPFPHFHPCAWRGRAGRPVPRVARKGLPPQCQGALQIALHPTPEPDPFPVLFLPFLPPEPDQKTTASTGRGISSPPQRPSAICFGGVIGSL